ncbi:MAG: hypothetical protein WDM77_17820 [Steroidobacteraceae bacterium]
MEHWVGFAPQLLTTEYALEMWSLYQKGELHANTPLTGVFETDLSAVDADGVLEVIDDAREEAIRRELGREVG